MAQLLYDSGLRLMECLRLRVKDVDISPYQVIVRDGKGMKDRVTMLPTRLIEPLHDHLQYVQRLFANDRTRGYGKVYLPFV